MPVLCITGYFPLSITVYQILSWRSYNKRMYKLVLNKKKFTITQITNKTITGLNHMCIRNRNCLPFASTWVHPRVFSCFLWGPCCSPFYVLMSLICVVVWFYLLLFIFRLSLSSRHLLTLSFISGFSIHDCLFSFLKRLFGYSQIFLLSTIVYQSLSPQSYDKRTYMLVSNKNKWQSQELPTTLLRVIRRVSYKKHELLTVRFCLFFGGGWGWR